MRAQKNRWARFVRQLNRATTPGPCFLQGLAPAGSLGLGGSIAGGIFRLQAFFGGYGVDNVIMVVIITTMNSKVLIKMLEKDGWVERSCKGSHHIYTHPTKPGHVSVPHPKQDLGVGITNKLLKQAGLK